MTEPTQDHLAEFQSLLAKVGSVERARRHLGPEVISAEIAAQEPSNRRRLDELWDLLRSTPISVRPVEGHIEHWIETHPTSLTGIMVKRVIDSTPNKGNGEAWGLQIGDPADGGRYYPLSAGMVRVVRGQVTVVLPDSIAEEFRQQGRRKTQRAITQELGL